MSTEMSFRQFCRRENFRLFGSKAQRLWEVTGFKDAAKVCIDSVFPMELGEADV